MYLTVVKNFVVIIQIHHLSELKEPCCDCVGQRSSKVNRSANLKGFKEGNINSEA